MVLPVEQDHLHSVGRKLAAKSFGTFYPSEAPANNDDALLSHE